MVEIILKELQELKKLTLLAAKPVLTMDDAALYTGMKKSYLYKLVSGKQIPYFKSPLGKLTYFDKDELTDYLLRNRYKPAYEIESEAANYLNNAR